MQTISASVIIGNPTAPCSGSGVCEMQATNIGSSLAFNANLSSKGTDLTINIPVESLNDLEKVRPDIYENLTSDNPNFGFNSGSLPFYLDLYVTQKIFPNSDYLWLDEKTTCIVSKQNDGSVDIYFPQVNPVTNGKYGSTGSFDEAHLTSGNWQIGVDVYRNLIFKNPISEAMFIFGSNGNISCNRYSVKLSGSKPAIPTKITFIQPFVDTWDVGNDDSGNLWITNGVNNIVFTVANIGLVLNTVNIYTKYTSSLPDSQLDASAEAYKAGDWTIQQDTNGNLCFYNTAFSYFFTKDNNIYVGQTISVTTNAPLGG